MQYKAAFQVYLRTWPVKVLGPSYFGPSDTTACSCLVPNVNSGEENLEIIVTFKEHVNACDIPVLMPWEIWAWEHAAYR